LAAKRDYYEILGVDRNATEADIKKAYRRLAKQYHPDVNKGDADAEAKFKEINEAYSVLSDSEKRARYDRYGHAAFDETSGFGGFDFGFGGLDDLFESFMGFGRSRTSRRTGPQRGNDLQYSLEIDFMEAAFGATKELNVTRVQSAMSAAVRGRSRGRILKPANAAMAPGRSGIPRPPRSDSLSTSVPATCAAAMAR